MKKPRPRSGALAIENNELHAAIKTIERICDEEFKRLNIRITELETENATLRGSK